jgi:hypothetical protein
MKTWPRPEFTVLWSLTTFRPNRACSTIYIWRIENLVHSACSFPFVFRILNALKTSASTTAGIVHNITEHAKESLMVDQVLKYVRKATLYMGGVDRTRGSRLWNTVRGFLCSVGRCT